MTQDTRKDRRVKIVSLNVRYKSATVDEFIENHSYDVSKGGIFIKTPNPFPPGTLLKFEIRLSGDQAVIAGVGRVVWKRDNAQSVTERPPGMGVKFIKIDDASKQVIDKLIAVKADAGRGFDAEVGIADGASEMAPAAAATSGPAKLTPIGGIAKTPSVTGTAATSAMQRKATMMGIGAVSASQPPSQPPRPSSSAPPPNTTQQMFPQTNSEADMPPKQEQTVMKQAAELLEEALRDAGGSMDEIGSNPLFAGGVAAGDVGELAATGAESPAAKLAETSGVETKTVKMASAPPIEALARDAQSTAAVSKSPGEPSPPTARESPSAKSVAAQATDAERERKSTAGASPSPTRKSSPPRTGAVSASDSLPKNKGGGGAFIGVFVVLLGAGAAVFYFRDKIFGSDTAPVPTQTAAPSASAHGSATAATTAPSPTPSDTTTAATAVDAAPMAPDAAPTKPDAAPTAAATSTAAATTTAPATATHTATAVPPPKPPPPPVTATAEPAPKPPTPKPKPQPTSDNPY